MKVKDLVSIEYLEDGDVAEIFRLAGDIKRQREKYFNALAKKTLAMIFEKPSLRTRFTFETGIYELGGMGIYLGPSDISLNKREGAYDIAKNLERWAAGIMIRTFSHENVRILAQTARIPVINGLCDFLHPCQALTDLFTFHEHAGTFAGKTIAYVGDGNNVAHSLMWAAARSGLNLKIATPEGYAPDKTLTAKTRAVADGNGAAITLFNDPVEAVANADAVYTDVWASMGQEDETEKRRKIFLPYQVNPALMKRAKPGAYFMHCLPAHRGDEVVDEVIDAPTSIVYDQAENRLHVQKAVMYLLMK